MPNLKPEADFLMDLRLAAQEANPEARLFRNNVGAFRTLKGERRVRCGLAEGSGDLIGWVPIEITQDMIGQKVAVFVSLEAKQGKGRATRSQNNWIDAVNVAGGVSHVVRSEEEVRDAVRFVLDWLTPLA